MSRPFNFFGFAESGNVSAYPSNFSGFYMPLGMEQSPDGFLFTIDSDAVETTSEYTLRIRGEAQNAGPDNSTSEIRFSGSFFPINTESGTVEYKFTGAFNKTQIDSGNFTTVFTGNFEKSNIDIPTLDLDITGKFFKPETDANYFFTVITGSHNFVPTDNPSTYINMYGNFIKYEKDYLLLDETLSSISWSLGYVKRNLALETGEFNIDVGLSRIFWSRAGS